MSGEPDMVVLVPLKEGDSKRRDEKPECGRWSDAMVVVMTGVLVTLTLTGVACCESDYF
jgi:hypothetical protein